MNEYEILIATECQKCAWTTLNKWLRDTSWSTFFWHVFSSKWIIWQFIICKWPKRVNSFRSPTLDIVRAHTLVDSHLNQLQVNRQWLNKSHVFVNPILQFLRCAQGNIHLHFRGGTIAYRNPFLSIIIHVMYVQGSSMLTTNMVFFINLPWSDSGVFDPFRLDRSNINGSWWFVVFCSRLV